MPLGFAKSVLTTAAPAAASPSFDLGFFNSNELGSGSNGAGLLLDAGSGNYWPINNKRMTLSVWLKGTTADLHTDNKMVLFRQLTETDGGFFVQIQNNGTECFFQETNGGNKGLLCFPTNFETNIFDDQWHHFLWYCDTNPTQTASNAFYVDGVAQTLTSDTKYTSSVAITQHRYGKHNSNDNTTADNTDYYDSRSSKLEVAQLWLDFGYHGHDTDFTKFYDNGPVDMGSYGTGTGLSQPDIFLNQLNGNEVNYGGNFGDASVSVINEGSGSYSFSDTGGPTGSGTVATEFYTFRDSGSVNTSNKATYIMSHTTGPFTAANKISIVAWIRANGTASLDSPYTMACQIYKATSPNGNNGFNLQIGANHIQTNIYNQNVNPLVRSDKVGGPYETSGDYQSGFLDGTWHCVMAAHSLGSTSERLLYVDGVDVANFVGTGTNGTSMNQDIFKYFPLKYNHQANNTNYTASFEAGADFDIGPVWYYDTFIDFTNSTVRGYYYNASNTDGFVDGGHNGTAGGAATPDLYFYTGPNGGVLGRTNGTGGAIATASNGGSITISKEGAGTGDTY